MTVPGRKAGETVSLFAFATTLLRNRWRIARWALVGAVLAVLPVIGAPRLYVATAAFIPEGSDAGRSAVASLAGQLGVSLAAEAQQQDPEFYVRLMKSRELLRSIVWDTLTVREMAGRRIALTDLFKIRDTVVGRREELGIALLRGLAKASVDRVTGIVDVSVATQWPSVSLAIASALVDGVNVFNQRTRQSEAAAERRFVDERLAVASVDLRAAEDRLEHFLRANRDVANSPQLAFERDRLLRDLSLRQQMFTRLTQSYEDARILEVRNTPVITVVEAPAVRSMPEPRGRLRQALLGLVVGGLAGMLVTFTRASLARRRHEEDGEVREFLGALDEVKLGLVGALRRLGARNR